MASSGRVSITVKPCGTAHLGIPCSTLQHPYEHACLAGNLQSGAGGEEHQRTACESRPQHYRVST
eukprot:4597452-Amphidinium_carterae.3